MPGWLWVVIAVVLAVVIYVLLRGRGGAGRHRSPGVEYAPALEDGASRVDVETGFGPAATAGLDGAAAAPVGVAGEDAEDRRWAPTREEDREAREAEAEDVREEEQAEDAELRHDEGYVETLEDPPAAPEAEPAPAPQPVAEPTAAASDLASTTAAPATSGTGPQGWTVKGNADSMLYYTADAPGFGRAAADVWFEDEEAATKAGFTRWDAHHR